jgi:hypothetical protein
MSQVRTQLFNVHPSGSSLLVEGRLKKADGAAYAVDEKVTFVNNGILFLFDSLMSISREDDRRA